jgi:hypothetical protein
MHDKDSEIKNNYNKDSQIKKRAVKIVWGYSGYGGPNCWCCAHLTNKDIKKITNRLRRRLFKQSANFHKGENYVNRKITD